VAWVGSGVPTKSIENGGGTTQTEVTTQFLVSGEEIKKLKITNPILDSGISDMESQNASATAAPPPPPHDKSISTQAQANISSGVNNARETCPIFLLVRFL